ncbi:MAG TPA: enoyl-CoA hydratase-related protein [Symbiobacteriaceae bacterium]|jgi:enoyl-CoA hydratase/carnithine racemase|nr:enoyl-CoA hydratase-related protein [Symbiobacteriaceae bacterium]
MTLVAEIAEGIATLTINRPEHRNSLSAEVMDGLIENLARLRRDPDVRAILLTGAGEKAFCAGGDLTSMAGDGAYGGHLARRRYLELLEALLDVGKPTVAAVNGAALGGGFGLVLACDLAVAADTATFGTPEVKVGLFPMMVAALLVRHVGPKQAMELALTGERVDAGQALALGLVNRVVSAGDLLQAATDLAGTVGALSPAVLRLGREAIYTAADMEYRQSLRYLHSLLTVNASLEDAAEGVSAFLERRPPQWKGK